MPRKIPFCYLRGSAENAACFGIKFDQSGKETSFGVAIFSRTGKLHTEVDEIKLPTLFNEKEKQDITYQVNEFQNKKIARRLFSVGTIVTLF